jgi:hypothetical protein
MNLASALELVTTLVAGDPPRPAFLTNPLVDVLQCDGCQRRYMGTAIFTVPTCPSCLGELHQVDTWDLRYSPWPWRQEGGE